MELYRNIKNRRIKLKITQQQLADMTGYNDRSSIAKIESGLVDIPQSKLELFAKVLHTTPGELMGDALSFDTCDQLNHDELTLISRYRELNDEGKEKVTDYVYDLAASGRYIKSNKPEMVEGA